MSEETYTVVVIDYIGCTEVHRFGQSMKDAIVWFDGEKLRYSHLYGNSKWIDSFDTRKDRYQPVQLSRLYDPYYNLDVCIILIADNLDACMRQRYELRRT